MSVLQSTKWCFVFFILQERLDLAALGTTSWVAEAPSFSTWEKHEVAENIPGDDQCHRLDGWNKGRDTNNLFPKNRLILLTCTGFLSSFLG